MSQANHVIWEVGDRFRVRTGSVCHIIADIAGEWLICECGAREIQRNANHGEGRRLCKANAHLLGSTGRETAASRGSLTAFAKWLDARADHLHVNAPTRDAKLQATALHRQADTARGFRDSRYPEPRLR